MNASHEIIKEQTKSKVEDFFKSVSANLDLLVMDQKTSKDTDKHEESEEKSRQESVETAAGILNITEDISKSLALTVDVGSSVEIKLPNISMTVMKKKIGETNNSVWEADNLKVSKFLF